MRRFIYCLFALLVVIGATGAELQLPQETAPVAMDCQPSGGICPCGMPMPQRGPQPCNTSVPSSMAVPTPKVTAVGESATSANQTVREPKPWPAAWTLLALLQDERTMASEPIPLDAGPPLLVSERLARLRVYLI